MLDTECMTRSAASCSAREEWEEAAGRVIWADAGLDISVLDGSAVEHTPGKLDHRAGGCELASCMTGTVAECQARCESLPTCRGFSRFVASPDAPSRCWLKAGGAAAERSVDSRFHHWTRPSLQTYNPLTHPSDGAKVAHGAPDHSGPAGGGAPPATARVPVADVVDALRRSPRAAGLLDDLGGPEAVEAGVRRNASEHGAGRHAASTYLQLDGRASHDGTLVHF